MSGTLPGDDSTEDGVYYWILDENRSFAEELKNEGYSEGTVGAVQTFFLTGVAGPWTAETLAALAPIVVKKCRREWVVSREFIVVAFQLAVSADLTNRV